MKSQIGRFIAITIVLCAPAFAQSTYYVSFSTGSDSNTSTQAKSKTTPWKNLKWMKSATSNAASYTVVAGDTFVLMGCDDWPNASFPITGPITGTSGAHITVTVDQTWYNTTSCPSSWNRPIFDAGSAVINTPECSNPNMYMNLGASAYVDFYWIELKNFFWTSANVDGSCFGTEVWIKVSNSASHVTINDFYIHSWTVTGCGVGSCGSTTAGDISAGIFGSCGTCLVDHMVADNSDGTWHTGLGDQWPTTHSILTYLSNAIKPSTAGGEYGYNDINHIGASPASGVHPNCIETIGGSPVQPYYIHDNRIHDNGMCEGLQVGNANESDYVWNNLWYNNTTTGANGPDIPQNCSTNVTGLWYVNNTNVDQRSVCASFSGCSTSSWTSFFVMENNHCITNGTPSGTAQSQGMLSGGTVTGATTITFGNNIVESLTTANGQGYNNSQTYVYSPTSGGSPTVGAGTNLTGSFPGSFSTLDTTYACTESTVAGVVQSVCPARTANSRPTSGAWDSGAYEYQSAPSSPAPAPSPGSFSKLWDPSEIPSAMWGWEGIMEMGGMRP